MNEFEKIKILKNRSKLKNTLNNQSYWLVKTNNNVSIKWHSM